MKISHLTKKYGDKVIYNDFSLEIEDGSVLAVLGVSGSGKTTLLNILAGLTEYDGEITGETKPISFVFQTDRLLPNLTVEQNLKLINPDSDALDALKSVGLEGEAKSYPKELSGGMARRVALVRAFFHTGKLMLLDEPFRNLDTPIRYKLMRAYADMRKNDRRTTVFVTHDVDEALSLCDRVIVIGGGKATLDKIVPKEEDAFAPTKEKAELKTEIISVLTSFSPDI